MADHPSVPRVMALGASRWALSHLATAVLLVLALVGGLGALWQSPPNDNDPRHVPALVGALASVPGDVGAEVLLEATFGAEELPDGDVEVIFYRITLPPGARLPYLAGPLCGCWGELVTAGTGAEIIQSGVYRLRLDAPIRVQRSGTSRATEAIPARTEAHLGPGDTAIYSNAAAPSAIGTVGDEPVVLLGVAILSMDRSGVRAPRLPPGVKLEKLTRTMSSEWKSLPSGPLTVSVWRLTLPNGLAVGPYEATGLEALRIETGAITRGFLKPGETVPGNPPLFVSAGTTAPFMAPAPGMQRIIMSAGNQPAVFLVHSLEPAGVWSRTLAP